MLGSQEKSNQPKVKSSCGQQYVGILFLVGGMILALWCAGQAANAAEPFVLTSPAFKDGTQMPKTASNNTPGNANCVGENVSPPLSWSNPPTGTKSFALTMVDPEGRGGTGVVHWVAYGIPVSVTGFAEGEVSKPSSNYVGGKGTAGGGATTYMGPCPPRGAPHHYTFILIATDLEPKELPPGLTREELYAKLTGHTKGATGLVGLFGSP
jgi:Raf kinase inhibitor-like YbhB/YbcL family protein